MAQYRWRHRFEVLECGDRFALEGRERPSTPDQSQFTPEAIGTQRQAELCRGFE